MVRVDRPGLCDKPRPTLTPWERAEYLYESPASAPCGGGLESGGSPIFLPRRNLPNILVIVLLALLAAKPAEATTTLQSMPAATVDGSDPTDGSARTEAAFRPHAMLLGGVGGLGGSERHPFGGVEVGAFFGRFGALAMGQYGDGNGFRSRLVAGGPAVEIADLGYASFAAYGGVAWYEEEQEAGFVRDMTGPTLALTARIPLPVGAIGMTLSLWRGSVDGEGFAQPATATGRRLSVGFGW